MWLPRNGGSETVRIPELVLLWRQAAVLLRCDGDCKGHEGSYYLVSLLGDVLSLT